MLVNLYEPNGIGPRLSFVFVRNIVNYSVRIRLHNVSTYQIFLLLILKLRWNSSSICAFEDRTIEPCVSENALLSDTNILNKYAMKNWRASSHLPCDTSTAKHCTYQCLRTTISEVTIETNFTFVTTLVSVTVRGGFHRRNCARRNCLFLLEVKALQDTRIWDSHKALYSRTFLVRINAVVSTGIIQNIVLSPRDTKSAHTKPYEQMYPHPEYKN